MQQSNEITQLKSLENTCRQCKLRNLCSVNTLCASERERFSDVIIHDERLDRGQHLFLPGDRLRYIYIVHSGSFKVYITNNNGDTLITGFYFPGDVLDLNASNNTIQNYGAVSLETSTVCKIPLTEFEKAASQYPDLSNAFLKMMSREIILKQRMILVMSKMKAEQKVADFLVQTSTENKSQGYSSTVFKLSMTHIDVANYLGLAIETVSRIFNDLQNKGIISIERHQVSIENFDSLKSLLLYDDTYTNVNAAAISPKYGAQR